MAATWRKAICPHLYTQVRSNENKSDWKHHILKGSRKDENCVVSFSKNLDLKVIPIQVHFPDYKMFLSNGSRTTSLHKLNLYIFTFTFLDCLSGGSLTTSLTTGWAERSSPEARCPLTHSFSISRSVCECELRKWKWFSSMTKCVWNLYHIPIMDGSESINCAGRSQNRAFMGCFRRAVCKVNKVKKYPETVIHSAL